jgi:hypothetical protein
MHGNSPQTERRARGSEVRSTRRAEVVDLAAHGKNDLGSDRNVFAVLACDRKATVVRILSA